MKKLLLYHGLCPGDVAIVTMAVESLHRQFPNQFLTDIITHHNELFKNNPLITPMDPAECQYIDMRYDRIDQAHIPFHFAAAFCDYLGDVLGLPLRLQVSRPHFYLSPAEKAHSVFSEKTGEYGPYALINAGYKNDFPAKWAGTELYQSVVDEHKDRIRFVQIGAAKDNHPILNGAINLIGKTTLRELLRLCHGASFGIGGVTALEHFMAGFEKPYICLIGGREPVSWIGYPTQISLNTQGLLPCCKKIACWKSTLEDNPAGTGCLLPMFDEQGCKIPTCMGMLKGAAIDTTGAVIDVIESIPEIVGDRTLISIDRLKIIRDAATSVANLPGEMVEFGCYRGGSSKLISRCAPNKILHIFDGFDMGIPDDDQEKVGHKKGEFASPVTEVFEFLSGYNVQIHPGRFPETAANLSDLKFCFAHLDFDTYQSTRAALSWVWPRMVANGIVVFDDYNWNRCPGVKRAVYEVLPDMKTKLKITTNMQATLTKPEIELTPMRKSLLREMLVYSPQKPKRRFGSKNDGGYVVPDLDIGGVDCLISVGVGDNIDFEKDFAKEGKTKFKFFDPTISAPEDMPANSEFFPVGLGVDNNSIESLMKLCNLDATDQRVWLKIDIEGHEWKALELTDAASLKQFEVIIVEFHGILEPTKNMGHCLRKINQNFRLIHAHANNCGSHKVVSDICIPDVVEMTYMRKDLLPIYTKNHTPLPCPQDSPSCGQPEIDMNTWPWVTPTSS